jgi:hypothetical protein
MGLDEKKKKKKQNDYNITSRVPLLKILYELYIKSNKIKESRGGKMYFILSYF